MDQRQQELKELKRAYSQIAGRRAAPWRYCGIGFLLLSVLSAALRFCPWVFFQDFAYMLTGIGVGYRAQEALAAVYFLAFLVCMLVARLRRSSAKRTGAYMDYRTMKLTLKAEKEEQ